MHPAVDSLDVSVSQAVKKNDFHASFPNVS